MKFKDAWAHAARPALALLVLALIIPRTLRVLDEQRLRRLAAQAPPTRTLGRYRDSLSWMASPLVMELRGNATGLTLWGAEGPVYVVSGAAAQREFDAGTRALSASSTPWLLARAAGGHARSFAIPPPDGGGLAHERRANLAVAAGLRDPVTLGEYLVQAGDVYDTRVLRAWAARPPTDVVPVRAALQSAAAELAGRIVLGLDHAAA